MNDTYNLIILAHNGDKGAEKLLVDSNLALVHSCVRKLIRQGYEYDDLLQAGSIGLIKAIRRFDTSLGLKFSTYAVPLIIGEIKRYMRDDSTLKVSRSLRELWMKAVQVREALTKENQEEPSVGEIAHKLGTDVHSLNLAMEACLPCESIWHKIGSDDKGDFTIADTVKDAFSVDSELEKIALKAAIAGLGERDRKIILLRYFRGKTQTEVSHIIGVSQVQISRIEKRLLASLKEQLK
ncbi:MAG: sigma-70 family RNA polymerase sigma factor [Clostridia bacterium]|nr:sigma-70 family RNA polymerase sigma factor [Clostridia bacterium]